MLSIIKKLLMLLVAYSGLGYFVHAVSNVTLKQLQEKIKGTYDIHDCKPFGAAVSYKHFDDVSLLWSFYRLENKVPKDFLGLVLDCKQLMHMEKAELPQLVADPDIAQYIFHDDKPIKFIGLGREGDFCVFAYRNIPEVEKKAYILAKFWDDLKNGNDYLNGLLLGYDEHDIELYYASQENPRLLLLELGEIMDRIEKYPRSFKNFSQHPGEGFVIDPADVASLRKRGNKEELEKIQDPEYLLELQTKLNEFSDVVKRAKEYLYNSWQQSDRFQTFMMHRKAAHDILRKFSELSIDELKASLGDRIMSNETIMQKLRQQ